MYTEIKINGNSQTVALKDATGLDESKIKRHLGSGQACQLADSIGLDPAEQIDLGQVAQGLRNLIQQVSRNFIQRDEMVEAFVTGLVAGEHSFVLGPPGTAKTAVGSQLADGIGGQLWRVLMNQDTTRDGLLGTIDPIALQNGTWQRRWSGLATCHVAIIDEVWKSSGQNANILLDALEERKAREGDQEHCLPLVSVLAMSNEIPDDSERQAIFDRFLIRLSVGYIKDVSSFEDMLLSEATTTTITQSISIEALKLLAAAAELWALNPPKSLMDIIKALWKDIGVNGRAVSDRRWRKTLKLACAYALLQGEEPNACHMKVAQWTLWQDPDEESEIRKLVMSKTDPFASEVLDIEALLADLKNQAQGIDPTDSMAKSEFASKGGKLVNRVGAVMERPGGGNHQGRLAGIKSEVESLILDVIRLTG